MGSIFPTFEVITTDGEVLTLVRDGRLVALDDPAVRRVAEPYGDPDALLAEDWIPSIPGITAPGSYEEFACDPAGYIYGDAGAPSSAR